MTPAELKTLLEQLIIATYDNEVGYETNETMKGDTSSEQGKDIFAHFGLAIYQTQLLEHSIVNVLSFLDPSLSQRKLTKSATEWDDLVDSFFSSKFKLTLGKMINELKAITVIDPNLEDLLSAALLKRNWLIHHYFRDRAEVFLTSSGRNTMLIELKEAQTVFRQADEALEAVLKPVREKFGITDEVIATEFAKIKQRAESD